MPKVMCPECKEVFGTRTALTDHKAKTGHKGGAVIYTEPKKEEKKKQTKVEKVDKKKPFECPRCGKRFKNKKALENHQRDKKHFDIKKVLGGAKPVEMKKLPAPKESKKEEPKEEVVVATRSDIDGDAYVVITNTDYEKIMKSLEALKKTITLDNISFQQLQNTDSWVVTYALKDESEWDYILFYCDFVEIEHNLESFLSLEDKINLDSKPKIFDMASLDSRIGVNNDIYGTNECLIITHEGQDAVSYGELIINISQKLKSDSNALGPEDLLLIGGKWVKPVPVTKPVTKTKKEQTTFRQTWTTRDWVDVDDDYYGMTMWGAEGKENPSEDNEEEEEEIETFQTNPVYRITDKALCIDKLVNVELVVIPKENPSEDDVQEEVNIEDDVQEEVNIEDDVQEEVNIEDDVQEGKIIVRGSKKLNVKGKPFSTDTYFIITETPKNHLIGRIGWENLSLNATLFRMWEDGYFSEDLDGTEHSLKNIVEFFKKNPESMFSFREMGVTTDIFTNFVVSESEKPTLTYDIVNIIDFDSNGIYTDKELVKVDLKEYPVSKALDVKIDDLDFDNWYYIDNSFNNLAHPNNYGREIGGRKRDGVGMFMGNGISLDWLNQNSELMKEPLSKGSKWEDLESRDVVISIRNKTKKNTSNPIFDKKPRHILLYTNFKLNDDNDLEYDEYKMGFYSSKGHDPSLLHIMSDVGKKNKKNPLKRFYPKTGNKRNYYLFPDPKMKFYKKWGFPLSSEEKSS